MRIISAILVMLLLWAGGAAAQEQALDPNAVPDKGIAAGGVGFAPDPFRVEGVSGGGDVDARQRNLGDECVGMITVQPDFRFTALTPFALLRFIFIADAVTGNGSLVIRDPNGDFHCNDNSFGVPNPTVEIDAAPSGDYNVWVGARSARVSGDLYVTTRGDITPGSTGLNVPRQTPTPVPSVTPTPIPSYALNPTLYPAYGTDTLAAGFLPDPYYRVVIGGGTLDVADSAVGDACVGYATSAPAFRVNWTGVSTRLRFLFAPLDDNLDAALVVQAPDGTWNCNRDFAGGYTDPQVDFVNPAAGTYTIWASDELTPDERVLGVLYVTEKQWSPETVPAAGTAPTDPIGGLAAGAVRFTFDAAAPDPYAVPGMAGGGEVDAGTQNQNCPGSYPAEASLSFALPQATASLRIFFVSDAPRADAALIVRMPDGAWYCNDDAFNGKQPSITVIGNASTGDVNVWIGSFDPGETIPGTLYVTRGNASPLDPTRRAPVNVGQ